jgi:acetyl-CoA carboxylase biotin carboxylase subunit
VVLFRGTIALVSSGYYTSRVLRRILVANPGEIALRILRACESVGIESAAERYERDRGPVPAR